MNFISFLIIALFGFCLVPSVVAFGKTWWILTILFLVYGAIEREIGKAGK